MIASVITFIRDEDGATAFEFGVIAALVSVVAVHGLYLLMRAP